MKKTLSCLLSLCMFFALCSPAYAADQSPAVPEAPTDFGEPIQETTYYDEELGADVTERIYFVPDEPGVSLLSDTSGHGWYRNEKSHTFHGTLSTTTTFAEGYFVWGNGNVTVAYPSGGYDTFPSSCTITEKYVSSGTGQYAGIFNKYAYVTYTFKFTAALGGNHDLSVTIRVSESGNVI